MTAMWNFTLHDQGGRERALASRDGFDLEASHRGFELEFGREALLKGVTQLSAALANCAESGAVALIGGHTGLWVAAAISMIQADGPAPNLYCFETRREHDSDGRFIFRPIGLLLVYAQEKA